MRNLSVQEMDLVSGGMGYGDGGGASSGAGGDHVKVLSDILSNIANDTLNCNEIANGNNILNFVGNSLSVNLL